VKSLVAGTAVMILLLVGSTRLPPSFVPDLTDSVKDACTPLLPGQRASNERQAMTALKTLSSAQADFRTNDRDRDGVTQFWRGDVAGLYTISPPGGLPIRLIEPGVAAADDRPLALSAPRFPKTFHGYRFRAIRYLDEDPLKPDPQRFAICAYPASPAAGKYMFVINENNSIFRSAVVDCNGTDHFPTDDELKAKWGRGG
jgi:hypothetical protein